MIKALRQLQQNLQSPEPARRSHPEIRITLAYLIFACLPVSAAGYFLARFSHQPPTLALFPTILLSIITAVLLFVSLRHAHGGWRRAEQQRALATGEAQDRIRYLSSHVQNLREEDRTRISREIHDELGQLLTGIKLELRMLENHLANRNDRTLNPQIDQLVEIGGLVDATIASVQRIASGLRPTSVDHLGLATAMMEESALFSKRTGIPCNMTFEDFESTLPADLRTAIFRIFQESLTNVARHAEADRVDATCTIRNGELTLTIRDNGRGMEPTVMESPKTLGLIGMIERAQAVGGHVSLKSDPMMGTEVVFSAPVPEAEPLPSGETASSLSQ